MGGGDASWMNECLKNLNEHQVAKNFFLNIPKRKDNFCFHAGTLILLDVFKFWVGGWVGECQWVTGWR